jgi:hypothetical protein
VVWPPDVLHAAWTDGAPMRAIVVELPSAPELLATGVIEGEALALGAGDPVAPKPPAKGVGRLAPRAVRRAPVEPSPEEGEPL